MSKRKTTTLATILLCSLLLAPNVVEGLAGAAAANETLAIDWYVVGGGGGRATAGIYTLDGSTGQATVGTACDTDRELCSGFWCWAARGHRVSLPLVLRSY